MTYRLLVVDDEAIARRKLRRILAEHADVDVVGECGTGDDAVAAIQAHRPDIVFLDLQMPGGDGFSVVQRIGVERMPPTVFVTAYDEHAVRAFEVHAVDYVLKPVTAERVTEAYRRAVARVTHARPSLEVAALTAAIRQLTERQEGLARQLIRAETDWLQWFVVAAKKQSILVRVSDVDWIEAAGNYVRLHTRSGAHVCRDSLSSLSERLDPQQFVRVHRFAIVNLSSIHTITPWFGGDRVIKLKSGTEVKLSRNYRREFDERLGNTGRSTGDDDGSA